MEQYLLLDKEILQEKAAAKKKEHDLLQKILLSNVSKKFKEKIINLIFLVQNSILVPL